MKLTKSVDKTLSQAAKANTSTGIVMAIDFGFIRLIPAGATKAIFARVVGDSEAIAIGDEISFIRTSTEIIAMTNAIPEAKPGTSAVHADTHTLIGTDPIAPEMIGASREGHTHTIDDITGASDGAGDMKKLDYDSNEDGIVNMAAGLTTLPVGANGSFFHVDGTMSSIDIAGLVEARAVASGVSTLELATFGPYGEVGSIKISSTSQANFINSGNYTWTVASYERMKLSSTNLLLTGRNLSFASISPAFANQTNLQLGGGRPGTGEDPYRGGAGYVLFGNGSGHKLFIAKGSDDGATKFVTFVDNGSMGVGATSPTELLTVGPPAVSKRSLGVYGVDDQFVACMKASTTTDKSYGLLIDAGTSAMDATLRIRNVAGSTDYFYIRGDGNIGVRNTSPGVALEVTGTIRASNQVLITGSGSPVVVSSTNICSNLNADLLDGLHANNSYSGGTGSIVSRDVNGDFTARYGNFEYLNMSHTASGATDDTTFYSSKDNYVRKNNATGIRGSLGLGTAALQASGAFAAASHGHNVLVENNQSDMHVSSGNLFYSQCYAPANAPYSAHWKWLQLPYSPDPASWGSVMAFDFYSDRVWFQRRSSGTWNSWQEFIHSGNLVSSLVNSALDPIYICVSRPATYNAGSVCAFRIRNDDNWGLKFWNVNDQYGVTTFMTQNWNSTADTDTMSWRAGNTGFGTRVPSGSYKITVNGNPGCYGYTQFTNMSDIRLKENFQPVVGSLEKILQLKPTEFNYNSHYHNLIATEKDNRRIKGFIAQELQNIFPEMVRETKLADDPTTYYDTNLSDLVIHLVRAIQELNAKIEAK